MLVDLFLSIQCDSTLIPPVSCGCTLYWWASGCTYRNWTITCGLILAVQIYSYGPSWHQWPLCVCAVCLVYVPCFKCRELKSEVTLMVLWKHDMTSSFYTRHVPAAPPTPLIFIPRPLYLYDIV